MKGMKYVCKYCGESDPAKFYSYRGSKCRTCMLLTNKQYKDLHIEETISYRKEYQQASRDVITAKAKHKRYTNPAYKFMETLRARQRNVLKGLCSTTEGLGCTSEELVQYITSKFQEGMTLENHGEWHIDHIVELCEYDRDAKGDWCKESEFNKRLVHYTNLRPLWKTDNLKRVGKIVASSRYHK